MHVKIEMRLLSIVLCVLFLLAGCGNGRGIPFEQLCDVNTGQILAVSGLQPSGEIVSDQGILSVQAELAQDPERFGGDIECHRIVLVQLDRQDVQDVQEVAVTTKPVHRISSN